LRVAVLLNLWSLATGSVIQTLTWPAPEVGQVQALLWLDNRRLAIAFQKSSVSLFFLI
jgi:hypothetical protein